MKDDWVQEPDDMEWSAFMQWVPDLDIVPFRERESLHWRLREIRLGIASLNRQWDTMCRDGRTRLREFERERGLPLSWAWEDPPTPETGNPNRAVRQAADAVSGLGSHAAQCAREIVYALRVLDPGVPADYLDAVPVQLLDAVVAGMPANVQLPSGQEAEVRAQWNGELEARLVPVAAWPGWPWTDAPGPTPWGRARSAPYLESWFRRMMGQILDPSPVPDTFLAPVAEQQASRDREVPGIPSWFRTGDAPPTEPGTPPGASFMERYPAWGVVYGADREDYEARTGRRWRDSGPYVGLASQLFQPDGTYVGHRREAAVWQDPGLSERIRQGFREAVAGTTVSRGSFQQYLAEDTGQEDGPDGHDPAPLEADVRGGHM